MFKHILVPLDGSQLSERALPQARYFARTFQASITLLEVLDPSQSQSKDQVIDPLKWQIQKVEAEAYLQGIASQIRQEGVDVEIQVLEGRTAENIVDYAHMSATDLLVLTTHGRSGISRWDASSVIQKVLQKIYLPVLVVRSYQPGGDDDELEYQRILMPIDCSRRAECALPAVIPLAEASGAEILLAHVIQQAEVPFPSTFGAEMSSLRDRMVELSRQSAQQYLEDLSGRIPVQSSIHVIESNSIVLSLHEIVEQQAVDLVTFCAHGQTGLTNWPYGSVASSYLLYGTASTLVVQDVSRVMVRPTAAEMAAEKSGRR